MSHIALFGHCLIGLWGVCFVSNFAFLCVSCVCVLLFIFVVVYFLLIYFFSKEREKESARIMEGGMEEEFVKS